MGTMSLFLQNYNLQNPWFCKKNCQTIQVQFFENRNIYDDAMANFISFSESYKIRLSNEVSNVSVSQGAEELEAIKVSMEITLWYSFSETVSQIIKNYAC